MEKLGGMRVLLTHGDRYGVKSGLLRLRLHAQEMGCSLVLFGHTHAACAQEEGGVLLVNPGALADGRYAVVAIEDGRVRARLCSF